MIQSYIWTTFVLITLQVGLTEGNTSKNCKTNVRGKRFIIAFPNNYESLQSTTQLHALIVSFNDRITEVKITSSYLLMNNTYFTKTVMVQPWSFERVIIPKELEIIGTEKSLKSIELNANFEISVYSIHLEPYTTDGYLAIPTDNFGTQYVVASYSGASGARGGTVTIIGSQDDTSVTIQLASEITYENKQYLRGDILNFNVSSSEVIQIVSRGNDLTGSVIISENPIGVISGDVCASNPGSFCDVLLEQSIPVSSWGTRHFYSTTGIQSGTSRYRMVTFFNDTSFNVNNNNIILGFGEFSEFDLVGNGLIVTSKPASLIQILLQIDGSTVDPSIIQVPTEDQFALFLGFTTPTHAGENVDGFINFVNIIVKSNERASLRLNGAEINNTNASILPYLVSENKITDSDYDLLVVQLPREEGLYYITQYLVDCSPMSAIVYGYERDETYGYAAGLSLPSNQILLTIFPFYTRLLGGDELNIRLPCRASTFTIMCQFGDSTLKGKSSGEDIICITPPLFEVGFMTIHASTDNGISFPFNGLIYVADENSLTPHITQLEEDIVLDITANKNEVLKWDPNIFSQSDKLSLGIQFISDPSSNSIEWSSMTFMNEIENSGEIRFNMSEIVSGITQRQQLEELPTSAGTYIIKTANGEQDKFITTKMKIIKIVNDSRLQACSSEALVMNQPGDVLPCPCTTAQARSDANFIEDEYKSFINFFHSGSDTCFRSSQTASGSGQQCCYKDGNINPDKLGAGTADAFSTDKSPPKHFQNDLLPWLPCCKFSNDCDVYLQYRPSDDCKNYNPPIPARTNGDPHFLTLDGLEYTFNGAGEFLLISSLLNNFTFQARMEIFQNTPASVYTAFVIRTGNSSKIQIERNNQNQILLHIEDQMLEIKEGILLNLIARESKIQITNDYSQVVVSFSHGVSLRVYIYATSMSFLLQLGDQYRNNVSGLMGNFNSDPSDDFMLPNGVIISQNSSLRDIHYNFGLHWMVNEVESIFTYQSPFDHSFYSNPNFTPLFEIPELENIDPEVRELCGSSFSCLYDATTTGMLSFANDTMQFISLFGDVVNNSESIVSCGRPDSVENGRINGSVFFVGNQVNVICNSGYQLNGSAELVCTENGEWFPVTSSCAEAMPLGPDQTSCCIGPRGVRGPVGPGGFQGANGDNGLPGACLAFEECFSYNSASPKGSPGSRGQKGERGADGAPGSDGIKGEMGDPGNKGLTGFKGLKGEKGTGGSTGDKGEDGLKGGQGDIGLDGNKGTIGTQGSKGLRGGVGVCRSDDCRGEKGSQGATGSGGLKGEQGAKGSNGETGSTGSKGEKGSKGDDGDDGPQGEEGESGEAIEKRIFVDEKCSPSGSLFFDPSTKMLYYCEGGRYTCISSNGSCQVLEECVCTASSRGGIPCGEFTRNSVSEACGRNVAVDIILVVDDTGSMERQQNWLSRYLPELEKALTARCIGNETGAPNLYQMIAYGAKGFPAGVDPNGRPYAGGREPHFVTNGTELVDQFSPPVSDPTFTIDQLTAVAANLQNIGGFRIPGIDEVGYEALEFALRYSVLRENTDAITYIPVMILLTNGDADDFSSSNYTNLLGKFRNMTNMVLAFALNLGNFTSRDDLRNLFGVANNYEGANLAAWYIPSNISDAKLENVPYGTVSSDVSARVTPNSEYRNVGRDYINLLMCSMRSSASFWDLDFVVNGDAEDVRRFTDAFIRQNSEAIINRAQRFSCRFCHCSASANEVCLLLENERLCRCLQDDPPTECNCVQSELQTLVQAATQTMTPSDGQVDTILNSCNLVTSIPSSDACMDYINYIN